MTVSRILAQGANMMICRLKEVLKKRLDALQASEEDRHYLADVPVHIVMYLDPASRRQWRQQ
jgi:hypothetical protein